jgi:hypothetical protein
VLFFNQAQFRSGNRRTQYRRTPEGSRLKEVDMDRLAVPHPVREIAGQTRVAFRGQNRIMGAFFQSRGMKRLAK